MESALRGGSILVSRQIVYTRFSLGYLKTSLTRSQQALTTQWLECRQSGTVIDNQPRHLCLFGFSRVRTARSQFRVSSEKVAMFC